MHELAHGAPDATATRIFWQRYGWPIVEVPTAMLETYRPPVVLHPGEHEILTLAQILPMPLMLLDDEVARAEAHCLQLQGKVGVRS
jgi:predicted nucleic acid-binding protein